MNFFFINMNWNGKSVELEIESISYLFIFHLPPYSKILKYINKNHFKNFDSNIYKTIKNLCIYL